jgi:hypothetical protein
LRLIYVNIRTLPLTGWLVAGLFCARASAEVVTARSYSGQFLAREFKEQSPWPARAPQAVQTSMGFLLPSKYSSNGTNGAEITLEPAVLVVSCERLKGIVLSELGLPDQWQGRIDLAISSALPEGTEPELRAGRDGNGWNYELDLPKRVPPKILEQALVQTLLLELVNRNAGERSAEIPIWLIDGLSAHLDGYNLPTFILQPDVQMASSNVRMEGSSLARELLTHHTPLTFEQLSWPKDSDLTGDGLKLYRACAQLFLEGLIQFPNGKDCLRQMLAQLPQHLNWQTALLLAYHEHFDQLLDVEKWWELTAVGLSRADATASWDEAQVWKRIQASLEVPAIVHLNAGQLPVEARYTLQEVINNWSAAEGNAAVERAIAALESMPTQSRPGLGLVAALYLKTLQNYLNGCRELTHPQPLGRNPPPALHLLKANTIQQLNLLDQQLAALRSKAAPQRPQRSAAQSRTPGASR